MADRLWEKNTWHQQKQELHYEHPSGAGKAARLVKAGQQDLSLLPSNPSTGKAAAGRARGSPASQASLVSKPHIPVR